MASSHRVHTLDGRTEEERPLTISFIHHRLDDHWKHSPVQVEVQLRKRGENSQTELQKTNKMAKKRGLAVPFWVIFVCVVK